jgi:hypothetical protein
MDTVAHRCDTASEDRALPIACCIDLFARPDTLRRWDELGAASGHLELASLCVWAERPSLAVVVLVALVAAALLVGSGSVAEGLARELNVWLEGACHVLGNWNGAVPWCHGTTHTLGAAAARARS